MTEGPPARDPERLIHRQVLLRHIALASRPSRLAADGGVPLPDLGARAAIDALAGLHDSAQHDSRPEMTAVTYARVWHHARSLSASIDPRRNPVGYARVLMFLHDSAQVPGRADIPFLGEQLNSITGFPRASIYGAERTADLALHLVPDDAILQAGITRRLVDIYLSVRARQRPRERAS